MCIEFLTLLEPHNSGTQANLKRQSWKKKGVCVFFTFAFLGQQNEVTKAMGNPAISRYMSQSQGRSSAAAVSWRRTPGCRETGSVYSLHRSCTVYTTLLPTQARVRAYTHAHTHAVEKTPWLICSVKGLPDKLTQALLDSLFLFIWTISQVALVYEFY